MKNVATVIGKFVRDCAVVTLSGIAVKATEAGGKKLWDKAVELKEAYMQNGAKSLADYEGILSDKKKENQ